MRTAYRHALPLLIAVLALLFCGAAFAELGVSVSQGACSYMDNTITVTAPSSGTCVLEMSTCGSILQRMLVTVHEGTNSISWNGLGFASEPFGNGCYTITARFTGSDGCQEETVAEFSMGKQKAALIYAIPSGDVLYLDSTGEWALQISRYYAGSAYMKIAPADDPENFIGTVTFSLTKGSNKVHWDGRVGGKRLAPGTYRCVCSAVRDFTYPQEFTITIAQGKAPSQEVAVTGAIIPSRYATDEEIWAMMTAPAVVFRNGEGAGNAVRSAPGNGSSVVGYVRGTTVAVEVIRIEGTWAYIGAWCATRANYIEGYVPLSSLKVVQPAQDYGLLIDKQTQTLWLFDHGERVASMKISTGKPHGRGVKSFETEAGSCLTGTRLEPFITDGSHYDYPIRINGGNLIHSVGYTISSNRRNYSDENAQLGTRVSHGCVRMERTTGGRGINAWWMWTHLRLNTRVIIWDNPEDRAADNAEFGYDRADMPYTGAGTNGWD